MINRVIIDGYLGGDPEVKKTTTGKSVCNFSIAQTSRDSNGNQMTKWFKATAWERSADYLGMYCKKGDLILIDGRMDYKEFERDGQRNTSQEINASTVSCMRKGNNHKENQDTYQPKPSYQQATMAPQSMIPSEINDINVDSYDLPF